MGMSRVEAKMRPHKRVQATATLDGTESPGPYTRAAATLNTGRIQRFEGRSYPFYAGFGPETSTDLSA